MSNVFISHSSSDKRFVRKLATALLSDGFPVWLDSWKLELGDSLLDKIYDGVETSSLVLLVISRHAIESGWVNRELNAALSKEQQVRRKFVIPIRIDGCDFPLKVADRLYADFSSSFSAPFTALVDLLAREGCRDLSVVPERELVALSFTNGVHLDMASLSKALSHIRRRHGSTALGAEQILVNEDDEYEQLLRRLHARIDNVAADPYFSPGLERSLRTILESVQDNSRHLSQGVALLVTNGCSTDSVYWFARIVRGMNTYSLWSAQMPGAPDLIQYGKQWGCANLLSNSAASAFFETESVEPVHLWVAADSSNPFSIWIGASDAKGLRDNDGCYLGPDSLFEACSYSAIDKYVYPQLVLQHLTRGTSPIPWKLDDAIVGIR